VSGISTSAGRFHDIVRQAALANRVDSRLEIGSRQPQVLIRYFYLDLMPLI
jgi:hypothetical protein